MIKKEFTINNSQTRTGIHPTALVDPSAKIGEGVLIGPYTIVGNNVEIGDGTRIDSNARICYGARIGKDCHIFHGAVISEIPQDLKFQGEDSIAVIGDRTRIREFATIHRGTRDREKTEVGSDCLLMAYSHIAHDCVVGDHVILSNIVQLGGHVTVHDWAYIGGMVGVHQFTHIGEHAFIGGGYRCTQDVPPYILAAGEPLKYSGLNVVGLRRHGFTNETINLLKEVYRLIYRSEFNVSQALDQIQSGFEPTEEIRKVISFIQLSKRGIIC
ncbi:MAG: acyl-ACP--UDP-N-acetylglucosamine O-acyltransferase [Candidatus Aminicenantes bacterium]|nr:MAG: acyl-ACP--UDP-N-acetylglucosamine O-acyltransferase [Candidatus Aminicenantes bacterium]